MAGKLKRYIRLWWRSAVVNFSVIAASRLDFYTFIIGKILRMGLFFIFVWAVFDFTPTIAGYDIGQVLIFFAVMNIIDIITQMFWYRGMTDLCRLVRTGDFDLVLTKPISAVFWTSFRIFDFFDLSTLPAAFLFLAYALMRLEQMPSLEQWLLGLLVLCLGLVLAFSINLMLATIAFWTVEIENAWWIYRDLVYVARFPPEVFPAVLRAIFIFLVPILVIVSFPAKALLGILSWSLLAWAVVATAVTALLALAFWRAGLRHYTSASS